MRSHKYARLSLVDLPENLLSEILIQLPIQSIVMCKCTSKTLHHLITSTNFSRLHFARADTCVLLRNCLPSTVSRTLYLLEASEIDTNYCHCPREKLNQSANTMRLDTKLKLPLANGKLHSGNGNANIHEACDWKSAVKQNPTLYKFKIVNSCNGFICLEDPLLMLPTVVCNPVTNEYLNLPDAKGFVFSSWPSGIGLCPNSDKYKVFRVIIGKKLHVECPITGKWWNTNMEAEIHTLGTKSWKSIGYAPYIRPSYISPTNVSLNGTMYWISKVYDDSTSNDPYNIISFDFSDECFRSLPQPPVTGRGRTCLGVIGNSLCLSSRFGVDSIDIWVLKKNCGIEKSWSKLISISPPVYGLSHFVSCSKCEAFFIFGIVGAEIVYCDSKGVKGKSLKFRGGGFTAVPLVYTPS
ncbi:unnamed protein product, partial [Cuscuta epithymum]